MAAELALRDGYTRPHDLPHGDCIMTGLYAEDGTQTGIRVDHADPRILISAEMLEHIAAEPDGNRWLGVAWHSARIGATLKIHGVNRTVIYRITGYVAAVHGYIAEWPD